MVDLYREAVTQGSILILNFDDNDLNEFKYDKLYDPDIDKLIGQDALPTEIWRPHSFADFDFLAHQGFLDASIEDEHERHAHLEALQTSRFGFFVWSKEKFSEDFSDECLLKAFKKRFFKSLPLQHINLIFVQDVADRSPIDEN